MDKKKQMQFNLNNFLLSSSFLFDKAEKNQIGVKEFHSKKMAYVALKIAHGFDFSKEELNDLCSYCLCHNVAINFEVNNKKAQLEKAEYLIEKLPFLTKQKNILKYQNEYFNGTGIYSLKSDKIPLFSQIICFIDTLDRKFDLSNENIENREYIKKFVEDNCEVLFSPLICDIFLSLCEQIDFWLELQNENEMVYFIYSSLADHTLELDFEEILAISSSYFDSNKDLIKLASDACDYYNFEHKDKQIFLIAASLCNIGKIAISDEILNKKNDLSKLEWEEIYAYPFYTKRALNNILGFKDICILATRVQENLNYEGYPYNLGAKDLSFKDRLLSILHKIISLGEEKNYRKAYEKSKVFDILRNDDNRKKIDQSILENIENL